MNLKPIGDAVGMKVAQAIVVAARARGIELTVSKSEKGYVLLAGPQHIQTELTGSGWAAKTVRDGVSASEVGNGY